MRAIEVSNHEGPAGVRVVDLEPPDPTLALDAANGLVTIRVRAVAVSMPDVLQARGRYQVQPPLPFVPGTELAGSVLSAPADTGLREGDAVVAYTPGGAMAEVALAPSSLVFPLPGGWSFAQGAPFVVSYHTAYYALVTRGLFTAGETVLVHGAAGAVGTACVQVAAGLGAHVVAVVSDRRREEACLAAGAHDVVMVDNWKDDVLAKHPDGVDLVLDLVGGDRALDIVRALAELGRWVVIGFASGSIPEIRVNRLLLKNVAAVGASWGAYAFSKPDYLAKVDRSLRELVEAGAIRPPAVTTFTMDQAAEAFAYAETRNRLGKVVIEV
jgi:NADPH2:quinone reductase